MNITSEQAAHPTANATGELVEALAAAELEFGALTPDATNPHFGSRYVTLGALIAATRPALARHGLVLTQTMRPASEGTGVLLVTTLRHTGGETLESVVPLPPWRGPQDAGSLLTYLRRYSAAGLLNLASEQDDDAEGSERPVREASARTKRFQERTATRQRPNNARPAQRETAASKEREATVKNPDEQAEALADLIDIAATTAQLDSLVPELSQLPAEYRPPLRVRFSERRAALAEIERDRADLDALEENREDDS